MLHLMVGVEMDINNDGSLRFLNSFNILSREAKDTNRSFIRNPDTHRFSHLSHLPLREQLMIVVSLTAYFIAKYTGQTMESHHAFVNGSISLFPISRLQDCVNKDYMARRTFGDIKNDGELKLIKSELHPTVYPPMIPLQNV